VVEAVWSASRDRDVVGYRVYREQGGVVEVACDFTAEPTCVDPNPPARTTGVLDYWAVALDMDPQDQEREGPPSNRVNVNEPNSAPNPPLDLILAKDIDGNSVLQWTTSPVPDPDGDVLESYVIYRDGTSIADRYDTVPGTQTTVTDHATDGVEHQYWVAAVDERLAESTLLGPVTG
jgi:hypothetical protein